MYVYGAHMAETLANHTSGGGFSSTACCPMFVGCGCGVGNRWRWCGGEDILLGPERTTRPLVSGFPAFRGWLLFLAGAIFHQTVRLVRWGWVLRVVGVGGGWRVV